MKKFLSLMLVFIMAFTAVSVLAEEAAAVEETAEQKVYDVECVDLGDYLLKSAAWETKAEESDFVVKSSKLTSKGTAMTVIGYSEENDLADKLVQFKAKYNFTNEEGGSYWGGFTIRDRDFGIKAWQASGSCYLFVIKHDRIELQRWKAGGQTILDVVPNDCIPENEAVNISVGAVNTDLGVCIVLFVDGKCIINVCDSDQYAVTEGEYFNIYATPGTEVSKYTGDEIASLASAPVVSEVTEDGYKFTADYKVITFGADDAADYEISWYYSDARYGENLTELDKDAQNEFGSKYNLIAEYTDLDITGNEIVPQLSQATGYFRACIEDAEGNIIAGSAALKADSEAVLDVVAKSLISESVALVVDYETAFVNGEKTQIDPDDSKVKPVVVGEGTTLVPVRFVTESFNATVGWNGDTNEVTIELDGNTVVMTLDETAYTVNGEEKQLLAAATLLNDRTMVPLRAISEAFGKEVFWEAENELIIISNEDLGINAEEDMSVLNYIAREIR